MPCLSCTTYRPSCNFSISVDARPCKRPSSVTHLSPVPRTRPMCSSKHQQQASRCGLLPGMEVVAQQDPVVTWPLPEGPCTVWGRSSSSHGFSHHVPWTMCQPGSPERPVGYACGSRGSFHTIGLHAAGFSWTSWGFTGQVEGWCLLLGGLSFALQTF